MISDILGMEEFQVSAPLKRTPVVHPYSIHLKRTPVVHPYSIHLKRTPVANVYMYM